VKEPVLSESHEDRERAAELYRKARELELRQDYAEARKCYEQSLRLHEDEIVRTAYLKLLASIGPR